MSALAARGERFFLERLGDGEGLLLDLGTGAFVSLNAIACRIWGAWLAGAEEAEIANDLSRTFAISEARAAADVRDSLLIERLGSESPDAWANEPYLYEQVSGGHRLTYRGEPMVLLDGDCSVMRLVASRAPTEKALQMHIRCLLSKMLTSRGTPVLHASAVEWRGQILAFAGASGAGKTTTARAFAAEGARLESEDRLMLRAVQGRFFAIGGGEPRLYGAASEGAERLLGGSDWQCPRLESLSTGKHLPLEGVAFVDVARRGAEGDAIVFTPVAEGEAIQALLRQTFLGSQDPISWRRDVQNAAAIAREAATTFLTVPAGLEELRRAVGKVCRRL